ncbi:uncharacterized protein VTP21DRAFT_5244 [Calcarisporiella thermophila]|uniref:uncharacterized protein n=1 Tax=Calcarisporiella thermophila TaxID=911321 RepID=UPI00374372E1
MEVKTNSNHNVWVFGYGSLCWKPPVAFEDKAVGYIRGYVRRFWQQSTDHRGTPDAPGRVVTLIPYDEWQTLDDYHESREDDVCWGVAYKIPEAEVEATRAYLDHREKNGYTIHFVDVYQPGRELPIVKDAMVYIGTTSNEHYIGPAPLDNIALQIYHSHGPSGANLEYLLNLAEWLRSVGPNAHDEHLFALERRVRELMLDMQTTAEEGERLNMLSVPVASQAD